MVLNEDGAGLGSFCEEDGGLSGPHLYRNGLCNSFYDSVYSPEEFKEFVERAQKADTDPNRFTTLEYNISLDDRFGAYTVRYHSKMEDRQAKVSPVDTQFLIMEITGYTFIHPDSPDLVLGVQYSDRYKKGEKDPSLDEIGEKFINNFKVMPLKEADNK